MRLQHLCSRRLVVVMTAGFAWWSMAPAVAQQRDIATVEEDAQAPPGDLLALPGITGIQTVHLRRDGTLAGRVSLLDATGAFDGVAAKIKFVGQTTASAESDSKGDYEVADLKPGIYAVLAAGEKKAVVSTVRVLPFDEDVPEDQQLLELPLVLSTESPFVQQLMACAGVWGDGAFGPAAFGPGMAPMPMAPAPFGAAPAGFGGGAIGGGIGIGPALGIGAAAAGIGVGTALSDDNDGGTPPPATPFEP